MQLLIQQHCCTFISINFLIFLSFLLNEFFYMNKQTQRGSLKWKKKWEIFICFFNWFLCSKLMFAVLLFINIAYNDFFLFAIKCWLMNEAWALFFCVLFLYCSWHENIWLQYFFFKRLMQMNFMVIFSNINNGSWQFIAEKFQCQVLIDLFLNLRLYKWEVDIVRRIKINMLRWAGHVYWKTSVEASIYIWSRGCF